MAQWRVGMMALIRRVAETGRMRVSSRLEATSIAPAAPSMDAFDICRVVSVAGVASAMAWAMFAGFFANPDFIWRPGSDREVHFSAALRLALAVQNHDAKWFLSEIASPIAYPPLHALTLAAILLAGGLDVRLGIVPSLIGWVATIVLTWMIAKRFFADRLLGNFAAVVAVTFAMSSPTLRYLASDVMLESGGAALTALAVWLYMLASAAPNDPARWRWLAASLTALFFFKSNYWALTAGALIITLLCGEPVRWTRMARDQLASLRWRVALGWLARQPLLLAFLAMAAFAAVVVINGPRPIGVVGQQLSMYPASNLITATFAVLCVWISLMWCRNRERIKKAISPASRAIMFWHVVPAALSLLVPGKIPRFLWYVGPFHSFGERHTVWQGLKEYWSGLAEGFHVGPWAAILALTLALVAVVHAPRMKSALRAPVILFLVSAVAVVLHPNQQVRFLDSWIFALWVCAGVGAALLLERFAPQNSFRMRTATVLAALVPLMVASLAVAPSPAARIYAVQTPGLPESELVNVYLPYLWGAGPIGLVATNDEQSRFITMTKLLQCRCRAEFDRTPDHDSVPDDMQPVLQDWVAHTPASRLIAVKLPGDALTAKRLADIMAGQNGFHLIADVAVPSWQARVMAWQR
jgi:hypothetical protein